MSDGNNQILFRCDAGDHIGGGHLIRCLAFANTLKNEGFSCSFLCNEQAWEFPMLTNSGFGRVEETELKNNYFKYIIVDHYHLNAEYERGLRPYCEQILVIDDLANRLHDCDILLDGSPSRKAEDYEDLVPPSCKLCLGIDYALLRDEFFKNNWAPKPNSTIRKIFITMGSIDGKEMLPRILEYLNKHNEILEIDILMTRKTRTLQKVRDLATQSKHDVNLHVDIQNPVKIMLSCDLAITAGGMTCLELVTMGVPSWTIIVADNQIENVDYLSKRGFLKNIENADTMDDLNLGEWLKNPVIKALETGTHLKIIDVMV